ncbi:hypothetical protein KC360_g7781 [Hortaea werneckii]|nr:hypothetical protein KC325_g7790 [Hortaea werneckii]KAI6987773.1 hypothetical protein KC359_g8115 [Hortaea werneckii]KAI7146496.1 hypothetical protein KC344_g3569 [Hortaea werneckii]KAI7168887.1 hypothetical protein KC360_g7781 [Hortaea werneckii]
MELFDHGSLPQRVWHHLVSSDSLAAALFEYNEQRRLDERHFAFDVSALLAAAAESVNRQKEDIKSFCKLSEGGFNRVFQVTMRDGLQIIARLPYPSTQPKFLATSSEVATMDLVRRHGVSTPLVYTYSADANNPVGSEYMVMEKVPGRCLADIWYELCDTERVKILGAIVDQEAKLFNIPLPAYGSIYKTSDLPRNIEHAKLKADAVQFCIGPDASLGHWFGTRSQLDMSRGPATTCQQVLEGGVKKEKAWLHSYGKPRYPFDREYREMFKYSKGSPEEHISSLEKVLKVSSGTVPVEEWLHKPVIRHPDLSPNNIFVDDDCNITSILDWQHSTVLPLYLHAGIPSSLQNYGDPDSEELKKPEFPSNLDELDEDDRLRELELYRRRHTHYYYIGATITKLNSHYKAMSHDRGMFQKKLYQHAVAPWEGNSIPLKADLVMLSKNWSELTKGDIEGKRRTATCPISLQQQDADETIDKMLEQEDIDKKMGTVRDAIGISTDGWVSSERYDDAVAAAKDIKTQAIGYAENECEREMIKQHWPFDDFDEDGHC